MKDQIFNEPVQIIVDPDTKTLRFRKSRVENAEPVFPIQLDWHNPQEREIWKMNLRYQGLALIEPILQGAPDSAIAKTLSVIFAGVHYETWQLTYKLYPQLRDVNVVFNCNLGCIEKDSDQTEQKEEDL